MNQALMPLSDVQAKLREKVHAVFLELISPEMLDAFVADAWKNLTQERPAIRDNYGRESSPAQSPELVQMIETEMRKQLQDIVSKWGEEWRKGSQAEASAKAILGEVTRIASQNFIESTARSVAMIAMQATSIHQIMKCGDCQRPASRAMQCTCGHWNN